MDVPCLLKENRRNIRCARDTSLTRISRRKSAVHARARARGPFVFAAAGDLLPARQKAARVSGSRFSDRGRFDASSRVRDAIKTAICFSRDTVSLCGQRLVT